MLPPPAAVPPPNSRVRELHDEFQRILADILAGTGGVLTDAGLDDETQDALDAVATAVVDRVDTGPAVANALEEFARQLDGTHARNAEQQMLDYWRQTYPAAGE